MVSCRPLWKTFFHAWNFFSMYGKKIPCMENLDEGLHCGKYGNRWRRLYWSAGNFIQGSFVWGQHNMAHFWSNNNDTFKWPKDGKNLNSWYVSYCTLAISAYIWIHGWTNSHQDIWKKGCLAIKLSICLMLKNGMLMPTAVISNSIEDGIYLTFNWHLRFGCIAIDNWHWIGDFGIIDIGIYNETCRWIDCIQLI